MPKSTKQHTCYYPQDSRWLNRQTLCTLSPSTTPYTIPCTLPPVTTPPPNTSVLGKHGRGSETSSETGEDGGVAYSQAFGLRTDFDIPKQVSPSVCAQQITSLYSPCKQMAEQNGHLQLRPSRTPAALGHLYNSAIRDGTVQITRCNHTRDCICLFACNNNIVLCNTNNSTP